MTQYYVYSSHNTFLTGDQLTSESSADEYKAQLERGLRSLPPSPPCGLRETNDGRTPHTTRGGGGAEGGLHARTRPSCPPEGGDAE